MSSKSRKPRNTIRKAKKDARRKKNYEEGFPRYTDDDFKFVGPKKKK